jgi:hypothetical protein
VDLAYRRHWGFTKDLDDDDPLKFSLSTPKRGASSYIRLFNAQLRATPDGLVLGAVEVVPPGGAEVGAPTSKRIIQDTNRFLVHLRKIMQARGCKVIGLGSNGGHRRVAGVAQRGGRRQKLPSPQEYWIHADARVAKNEQRAASAVVHAGGGAAAV